MRVCIITEHSYPHLGGGEKLFIDLALALKRNGVQVRIVTSASGNIVGKHSYKGVDIYSYSWPNFFGHPLPKKSDLIEHVEWADIIQTAQYTAAPIALRLANKYGKPCVFMAYELLAEKWHQVANPPLSYAFEYYEKYIYSKPFSLFVAISYATRKDLVHFGIKPRRIKVVYPVFNDFSDWSKKTVKTKSQKLHFLYFGRAGKTKGVHTLVTAIKLMDPAVFKRASFTLVLSGDLNGEKRSIAGKISRLGLSKEVRVLDTQPEANLKKLIRDSYCVIIPSWTEGFGYNAYQVSKMRKNLVVSNAGSLPEVVSGNHLIFKKGDPLELAKCVNKAMVNQFVYKKNGVPPPKQNIKDILALYKNLLIS